MLNSRCLVIGRIFLGSAWVGGSVFYFGSSHKSTCVWFAWQSSVCVTVSLFISTDFEDEGVDPLRPLPGWPRHGCSCESYCVCAVPAVAFMSMFLPLCVPLLSPLLSDSRVRVWVFMLAFVCVPDFPSAFPVCIYLWVFVVNVHLWRLNVSFLVSFQLLPSVC